MKTLRPRYGFTLVEVLIVMAVIGILAAIMFPVFARVRDTARTVSCAGNLRQIGLAVQQYTIDNNSYLPSTLTMPLTCSWVDRVYGYVKSPQVFQCPAFTVNQDVGEYVPGCPPDFDSGIPEDGSPPYSIRYDGSYAMNPLRVDVSGRRNYNRAGSVRDTRLTHPASTILVFDYNMRSSSFVPFPSADETKQQATVEELLAGDMPRRHRAGNNVLFADSHVKWLRLEDMTRRNLWSASGSE